jgi:hypothetical protein
MRNRAETEHDRYMSSIAETEGETFSNAVLHQVKTFRRFKVVKHSIAITIIIKPSPHMGISPRNIGDMPALSGPTNWPPVESLATQNIDLTSPASVAVFFTGFRCAGSSGVNASALGVRGIWRKKKFEISLLSPAEIGLNRT